jgi:type II secretory pathway pseudopilin PulG
MIVAVVIVGIMLGATGQIWSTIMKREREEELIFRGLMIRNAIERWYNPLPGQHAVTPLMELKSLEKDPRALQTTRHISRLYQDPMTGKEWRVIKDETTGIIGVASTSDDAPLKTGGFPEVFKDLEGKQKYSEWQFVYTRSTATGTPGTGTPGTVPAAE